MFSEVTAGFNEKFTAPSKPVLLDITGMGEALSSGESEGLVPGSNKPEGTSPPHSRSTTSTSTCDVTSCWLVADVTCVCEPLEMIKQIKASFSPGTLTPADWGLGDTWGLVLSSLLLVLAVGVAPSLANLFLRICKMGVVVK
ncbi:hypothetical protein E2C01_010799 [Portunus trituberculatus]|uniref:Uncharacterized protein n=1 Tax=Portunus trituberculatus TaxID=210409 RepID=A0A5B7D9C5_PORTR|nr:hypothetical protein [Portunus trituberculatus]